MGELLIWCTNNDNNDDDDDDDGDGDDDDDDDDDDDGDVDDDVVWGADPYPSQCDKEECSMQGISSAAPRTHGWVAYMMH